MPRPARSPKRLYSESTSWWQCSICLKLCKSKGGRTQHIRQLHGNVSNKSVILDAPAAIPLDQDTSQARPDSTQEEDMDALFPIDFDFRIPLSDANSASPAPHRDFTPISHPSALPSSPPSNGDLEFDGLRSNRGSLSPEASTTRQHPVMNGKCCNTGNRWHIVIF